MKTPLELFLKVKTFLSKLLLSWKKFLESCLVIWCLLLQVDLLLHLPQVRLFTLLLRVAMTAISLIWNLKMTKRGANFRRKMLSKLSLIDKLKKDEFRRSFKSSENLRLKGEMRKGFDFSWKKWAKMLMMDLWGKQLWERTISKLLIFLEDQTRMKDKSFLHQSVHLPKFQYLQSKESRYPLYLLQRLIYSRRNLHLFRSNQSQLKISSWQNLSMWQDSIPKKRRKGSWKLQLLLLKKSMNKSLFAKMQSP